MVLWSSSLGPIGDWAQFIRVRVFVRVRCFMILSSVISMYHGKVLAEKKTKTKKTKTKFKDKKKYFRTLSAEAPSSKTSGKLLFLCVFCFFGDPGFPNLWKLVFFCIYECSKHLVISEMSLFVAKFPEKTFANQWRTALSGTPSDFIGNHGFRLMNDYWDLICGMPMTSQRQAARIIL